MKRTAFLLALVALAVAAAGCGSSSSSSRSAGPGNGTVTDAYGVTCPASQASKDSNGATICQGSVDETAPSSTSYDIPRLADFDVELKTLSKQCFGSAGCNIDVKVRLTFVRDVTLDPAQTYDLTYRITGDESGPIIGTLQIQGDSYSSNEESISTSSSAITPRIFLTELEAA